MGERYRRMEGPVWHVTRILLKGGDLNRKLKSENVEIEKRGSEGEAPSRWAIFCISLEKIPILMPLDHISQVLDF